MKKLASILLSIFICLSLSALENQNDKLRILVYNTHGLPEIFIDDNPKKRFPIIGNKNQNYNISLLQEDYSHHRELSSGLNNKSIAIRGGMGSALLCPFCVGSGLT